MKNFNNRDCFAPLAMTKDGVIAKNMVYFPAIGFFCYCEERNDEAISIFFC